MSGLVLIASNLSADFLATLMVERRWFLEATPYLAAVDALAAGSTVTLHKGPAVGKSEQPVPGLPLAAVEHLNLATTYSPAAIEEDLRGPNRAARRRQAALDRRR